MLNTKNNNAAVIHKTRAIDILFFTLKFVCGILFAEIWWIN